MAVATVPAASAVSRLARRTGLVVTGLVTLFLLVDSVTKLLRLPPVVEATVQMGFPGWTVPVIGGTLLACLLLHLVPRTAVLGAVLLTGYLGGAVCAQLRIDLTRKQLTREHASWTVRFRGGAADQLGRITATLADGRITGLTLGPAPG